MTPGETATTTLTVRNDSDIVEAYSLEVVGDCAPWTTVEPSRVSLYPGTSETVTVRLAPPRSHQVRAGDVPLAVRVLPAEHPEAVRVPETVVHVTEFRQLRAELSPHRRRGWLRGRYLLSLRNEGNAPARLRLTPGQPGEELGFAFAPERPELAPGETTEVGLRVRTGKPVWFGRPVVWPFTVAVADDRDGDDGGDRQAAPALSSPEAVPAPLDAEFVQIPLLPRWLLALLAALLALLLAWFALVRPAVRSAAKEAADEAVQEDRAGSGAGGDGGQRQHATGGAADDTAQDQPGGGDGGASGGSGRNAVGGGQHSATIDVRVSGGQTTTGTYTVPAGTVFRVTDLVVANYQGDEGVVTISFGDRKITTIALETFRNQDYHWLTPIEIAANDTVTAQVTCAKPGTPSSGRQARECHEVLNVSGLLSDAG